MGNSNSNPKNIESEINDCFMEIVNNISKIVYNVWNCSHDYTQYTIQRNACLKIIDAAHKAFNSKTNIETITNIYLIPLIPRLNDLPIYDRSYYNNQSTAIKEINKLSSLINQYIELQKQDRIQSLENENNELKKTISQMTVHQNPPVNPYASAPQYDK